MDSKTIVNDRRNLSANNGQRAIALLEKLPPEAILKVVDVVSDVIRANKVMDGREQEFQHQLTMMREKNIDKKEKLNLLSLLLANPRLAENSLAQIVTAICNIAEGKNE